MKRSTIRETKVTFAEPTSRIFGVPSIKILERTVSSFDFHFISNSDNLNVWSFRWLLAGEVDEFENFFPERIQELLEGRSGTLLDIFWSDALFTSVLEKVSVWVLSFSKIFMRVCNINNNVDLGLNLTNNKCFLIEKFRFFEYVSRTQFFVDSIQIFKHRHPGYVVFEKPRECFSDIHQRYHQKNNGQDDWPARP